MNTIVALSGTWFDNPVISQGLPKALVETLAMVFWSSLVTFVGGLPLGLWLFNTGPAGLAPNRSVNRVLSLIVNIGRSIPFIILAVAIIPFTRMLVGSSLGWGAAVVPLSLGAIPFYARIVENAIREVDPGKVEAAFMFGSSRMQIVRGVQVREALPALISGFTVTVVALVSYSAMAGAIGGGGLGQMAINYGFSRFQADVMAITVIVIILIVQLIQTSGDYLAARIDHRRI